MSVTRAKTLEDVLKSYYQIPDYQRNYSWTEDKELEQLWQDVQRVKAKQISQYFFGPIFLMDNREEEEYNHFVVIDGQQRLASVTIFLAVIRDKLELLGDRASSKYHHYVEDSLPGRPSKFKVILNQTDNDYFMGLVGESNNPNSRIQELDSIHPVKNLAESNYLLRSAYLYFLDELKEFDINSLHELANTVLTKFRIFEIKVDSLDDAFAVFTSINAKGLDLATADLIKMHLYSIADYNYREVQQQWENMLDILIKNNVSDFIRRHWLSTKYYVSRDDLYREIKVSVNTPTAALKYARTLREEAPKYKAILNPDEKESKAILYSDDMIIKNLSDLNKLGSDVTISVLLSGFKYDKLYYRELVRMCLNLFFRYKTICNGHAGPIQEKMTSVATNMYQNGMTIEEVHSAFMELNPTNGLFKEKFKSAPKRSSIISRYILTQINHAMSLKVGSGDTKPDDRITLEHIMPQNEKAIGWRDTKPIHNEFVDQIGNLTLLIGRVNRNARDRSFRIKKADIYSKSQLLLNKELMKYDKWTDNEITARQSQFAELAVNIWKV